ncbi:MAG: hypothetical protein HYX53_17635 [Chloroflexi bacterium]|nr:hypothetical protein [Chloroflexota bacterium]
MLKGINLTLMIGPAVPIPVSHDILDALLEAQVVVTSGETLSGFELSFAIGKKSPLQTIFMIAGGAPLAIMRVVMAVTVNGTPTVIMDGVMMQHEVTAGSDPNHFVLKVKGKDLLKVTDFIDFSGIPYPAMPDFARVALILAKYSVLGMVPAVIPSVLTDIPIPTDRIPVQQGKDFAYVKGLADEAGYAFYLEPGPAPGMSVAYWGPEIRVGVPQPALNYNMDALTNVEALDFTFNNEGATLPVVFVQNQLTKVPIPIPIPNVSLLNPPLGLIPPIPGNIEPITGLAHMSPIRAALFGVSKAAKAQDVVEGTGTLDVLRYGRVLKARQLVGVRGAGTAFDGLYYVKSVTHKLKRGEYKQDFTLVRNGLMSTVPAVPV